MQKFIETITASANGTLVPLSNAAVTVRHAGTSTLATLYPDNNTVATLSNPLVSSATGLVEFYAADGRYDITVSKAGFAPVTIGDVLLEDPIDGITLTNTDKTFIRVKNGTNNGLAAGRVVMFTGVDTGVTAVSLATADSAYQPLYTVGVLEQDVPVAGSGRAITLGEVSGINTTGGAENWQVGDVLYISPTTAGALTKVEPTAPNVSISVAAVMAVSSTNGVLLVRPLLHARTHYGVFSSITNQTAAATNTAYAVTFNTTDVSSGVALASGNGALVIPTRAGLYNFQFSAQLAKSNSSVGYAWIWPRVNGVDVPNSATKVSIAGSGVEVVPAWNFVLPMDAGDEFQLMYAFSATSISFAAVAAETFCPAIPSVILTVTQVNQ